MSENRLKITMSGRLVASIWVDRDDETYKFQYCDDWIENGFAVSPHLKLEESLKSGVVRRFLGNLIPEGKGLEDITQFAHISKNNTFAIIKAIGYDTSGALMFGEHTNQYEQVFRAITDKELANRISNIEENSIVIWDKKERLGLAGVQEKLPVIIKDGQIGLGDGTLSSTHIMKFQTKKHANIVVNELFCMKLAKKINLSVAEVELYRFDEHPVLMVKRFDRIYKENRVERLHVIDGCQMLDLSSSHKYERNFGSGRDV
ncbi:MAG: HipA domain-containing protein, partial [Campylobacterota bacterium]|nr:HipA domain-containing protein [Campylobacterota bacterium]